jgi:hypothetical protein
MHEIVHVPKLNQLHLKICRISAINRNHPNILRSPGLHFRISLYLHPIEYPSRVASLFALHKEKDMGEGVQINAGDY